MVEVGAGVSVARAGVLVASISSNAEQEVNKRARSPERKIRLKVIGFL